MEWLFTFFGIVLLISFTFYFFIHRTARLFVLASVDVYRSMPPDLILEESVVEQIRNSKSPHVQNFLEHLFPRLYCTFNKDKEVLDEMNSSENSMKGELAVSLLDIMEKQGLIVRSEDSFTREEFRARIFLLEHLRQEAKDWYLSFLSGQLKNDNPEVDVNLVEVVFVSKIAGYKNPEKKSFSFF